MAPDRFANKFLISNASDRTMSFNKKICPAERFERTVSNAMRARWITPIQGVSDADGS